MPKNGPFLNGECRECDYNPLKLGVHIGTLFADKPIGTHVTSTYRYIHAASCLDVLMRLEIAVVSLNFLVMSC